MALYVLRKPLIELFMGIKQRWHDKMQQGPQLKREEKTVHQQKSLYCGQGNGGSQTLAALYERNHFTRS